MTREQRREQRRDIKRRKNKGKRHRHFFRLWGIAEGGSDDGSDLYVFQCQKKKCGEWCESSLRGLVKTCSHTRFNDVCVERCGGVR